MQIAMDGIQFVIQGGMYANYHGPLIYALVSVALIHPVCHGIQFVIQGIMYANCHGQLFQIHMNTAVSKQ